MRSRTQNNNIDDSGYLGSDETSPVTSPLSGSPNTSPHRQVNLFKNTTQIVQHYQIELNALQTAYEKNTLSIGALVVTLNMKAPPPSLSNIDPLQMIRDIARASCWKEELTNFNIDAIDAAQPLTWKTLNDYVAQLRVQNAAHSERASDFLELIHAISKELVSDVVRLSAINAFTHKWQPVALTHDDQHTTLRH